MIRKQKLVFCFFLTQTYFETANYGLLSKVYIFLMVCICTFVIIKTHGVIRVLHTEKMTYYMLVIPYLVLMIWSFILCVLENQLAFSKMISEIEPRIIVPFTACLMFYYFREKVISPIFWAASINYFFYIIAFVRIYGISGMFHYIALTDIAGLGERPLEVHEIVRAGQSATTGFHNDILMYYIDLGCIPALVFFYYLTVKSMKKIRDFIGTHAAINYSLFDSVCLEIFGCKKKIWN